MSKVKFSPQELEDDILHGIDNRYRPFTEIDIQKDELWDKCMDLLYDVELMNKIIFCNDVLNIPPTEVFLSLPRLEEVNKLSLQERRFLTAFFDYIFKFVFEYQEKHTKRVNLKGLGTGAYYAGPKRSVKVVEG